MTGRVAIMPQLYASVGCQLNDAVHNKADLRL